MIRTLLVTTTTTKTTTTALPPPPPTMIMHTLMTAACLMTSILKSQTRPGHAVIFGVSRVNVYRDVHVPVSNSSTRSTGTSATSSSGKCADGEAGEAEGVSWKRIPKGTHVWLSIYKMHRDLDYFKDVSGGQTRGTGWSRGVRSPSVREDIGTSPPHVHTFSEAGDQV